MLKFLPRWRQCKFIADCNRHYNDTALNAIDLLAAIATTGAWRSASPGRAPVNRKFAFPAGIAETNGAIYARNGTKPAQS
jgi:hypothetical protein